MGDGHEPASSSTQMPMVHHCPVPNCKSGLAAGGKGWKSIAGLRSHVDSHLLGQLQGLPPQEWMQKTNNTACRLCGRLVSISCNGGVHKTCLGREMFRTTGPRSQQESAEHPEPDLPSIEAIFASAVETRDMVSNGLWPTVERELNRCIANVVHYSRLDAWEHVGTSRDTDSHKIARRV